MPAQLGSSVLLSYGEPGAHQPGSSVLLSYEQGQASRVRVMSTTRGHWTKSAAASLQLSAIQPSAVNRDISRGIQWGASSGLAASRYVSWRSPVIVDAVLGAPWGSYAAMLNFEQMTRWVQAQKNDVQRGVLWSAFGNALDEERGSRWFGSKPSDASHDGVWIKPVRSVLVPQPFQRPTATAADFLVLGGEIRASFPPGDYVPPIGNLIVATFGDTSYRRPTMYRNGAYPTGDAVNFKYLPRYVEALDELGRPLTQDARCDPYKIIIWGDPQCVDAESIHPWTRFSRLMNPGWGVVTPPGPIVPGAGESIIVPVQRVYIVLNEVQLLRVSGMTPIPASALNITFDCDSWLPQFSATIPESARDAVMPDPAPVEVEAMINGVQFRFFVERITRTRSFGRASIAISGRGIACELDAPYAPASQHSNPESKTAQQLITDALTYTGYSMTWGISDWLIPANTFSFYGTSAQVAMQVAEASGSVLAADWQARDLRMLPRYPIKPWDWAGATPDYVIPSAVTETESIEWLEKPSYNVVYIAGIQNGILGQVKIAGSAGDFAAPMFTHQLITHPDAARQKGIELLSDTGRKSLLQISMPVLDATGIIDICRLIEFSDGTATRRGIVRANSINVAWPKVRQTITVEAVV